MKSSISPPGPRLGRFLLRESLGRGGEGEVFLAVDTRSQRPVALKVIREGVSSDVSERARREASFIASLAHRNIVQILALGHHRSTWYIAMEYVDGGSLFDHVKHSGPADPIWALRIVSEAAGALDAVHQLGILHCDVTPKNILLDRASGSPRLVDFGLSQLGIDAHRRRLVGTPQYVPPEIWKGDRASPKSDVYSLGLSLYYVLVGTSAVGARELAPCREAHLQGALEAPTAWPEPLRRLFQDATAVSPERRLSADELARRARALGQSLEERASRPTKTTPSRETVGPGLMGALRSPGPGVLVYGGSAILRRRALSQLAFHTAPRPTLHVWRPDVAAPEVLTRLRSSQAPVWGVLETSGPHEISPRLPELEALVAGLGPGAKLVVSSDTRFGLSLLGIAVPEIELPPLDLRALSAMMRPVLLRHLGSPTLITPDALLLLAEALTTPGAAFEALLRAADERRRGRRRRWLGSGDLAPTRPAPPRLEELRKRWGDPDPIVLLEEGLHLETPPAGSRPPHSRVAKTKG